MKVCARCSIHKTKEEFNVSKKNRDGLFSWCKECKSEHRKSQYVANKEKEAKQHKSWVSLNREKRRAQNVKATRAWQQNNQDKVRHWKLDNKHKRREAYGQGSVSIEDWIALCNKYGNVCLSCGKSEITMDHVVPLSKGGTHTIDNVQPLCGTCNSIKHDKTIDYRGV